MNENRKIKEHNFPNIEFINNNINKKFDQYSFKCLTNNLNHKMLRGTKEISFGIELENNGDFPWPINETFLLTDETKSMIRSEKISLDPLNPKARKLFNIKFKNMDKLNLGIYKNINMKILKFLIYKIIIHNNYFVNFRNNLFSNN